MDVFSNTILPVPPITNAFPSVTPTNVFPEFLIMQSRPDVNSIPYCCYLISCFQLDAKKKSNNSYFYRTYTKTTRMDSNGIFISQLSFLQIRQVHRLHFRHITFFVHTNNNNNKNGCSYIQFTILLFHYFSHVPIFPLKNTITSLLF